MKLIFEIVIIIITYYIGFFIGFKSGVKALKEQFRDLTFEFQKKTYRMIKENKENL